jgi:hypothetical protein
MEPQFNMEIIIFPARGDESESIQIEYLRQYSIQQQMDSEFWINLRPEFWPDFLD